MGARLLIVDDEPALLDLLKRYLERAGYQVETAGDSASALAAFQADPARYDMVITDLTLKGLGGEDLLERMREQNPGLRGLITSGYPHEPRIAGVGFLQKPFLPKMLVEAVEQALKA
jgi:DNA-binding NtrC family response regulator